MAKGQRKPTILTPAQWAEIRYRAEQGERLVVLAAQYGLHKRTLQSRSVKEDWQTPGRLKRQGKATGVTPSKASSFFSEHSHPLQTSRSVNGNLVKPAPSIAKTLRADLSQAVGSDPRAFQRALATLAESLLDQGLDDLEPPRTISEASKLNDLIRKARSLDASGAPPAGHVRPMQVVSRAPVIDVEPEPADPLDGFEI